MTSHHPRHCARESNVSKMSTDNSGRGKETSTTKGLGDSTSTALRWSECWTMSVMRNCKTRDAIDSISTDVHDQLWRYLLAYSCTKTILTLQNRQKRFQTLAGCSLRHAKTLRTCDKKTNRSNYALRVTWSCILCDRREIHGSQLQHSIDQKVTLTDEENSSNCIKPKIIMYV